ncbi:MAG: 5'/3'-nucleotidase SurE [Kofleriaceae bacterium]|nr:5'/3'-nucleotidase SurE [Kofleriaceae bacterium]
MRPLVLCSNDDGFDSPLLVGLTARIAEFADVLVVAPERQRSAASHAITLHKPLRITAMGPNRFALSGTPADCVYLGMLRLASRPPTLVVSGINGGFNLGTDVFYSGTVAAAIEGALRGSVGMAISMAPNVADPAAAIAFAAHTIAAALQATLPVGVVYNVNIPQPSRGIPLQHRWTRLGRRRYADDVAERTDPMGRPYYWIGGGVVGHDAIVDGDCDAVAQGYASITALRLDLSDMTAIATPPFLP